MSATKILLVIVIVAVVIGGVVWIITKRAKEPTATITVEGTADTAQSGGLPSSGERAVPEVAPASQPSVALTPASPALQIEQLQIGKGAEVKNGSTVTVHYTGTLLDGTKFDSSVDRGEPFSFVVGAGQVIKGWDQALHLARVGDKLRVTIPPELGYGARGAGSAIPPNATLVFEIEILKVK